MTALANAVRMAVHVLTAYDHTAAHAHQGIQGNTAKWQSITAWDSRAQMVAHAATRQRVTSVAVCLHITDVAALKVRRDITSVANAINTNSSFTVDTFPIRLVTRLT